jgi:hypothetical protein
MDVARLKRLFNAGNTCVRIVTPEEAEALDLALAAGRDLDLEPWIWSVVQGVRPARFAPSQAIPETEHPVAALMYFRRQLSAPSLCVMLDLAEHLSDPRVLRALRELVAFVEAGGVNGELGDRSRLALIDSRDDAPPVIRGHSARFTPSLPDDEEIEAIVRRTLQRINRDTRITSAVSRPVLETMVHHLRGLSRRQTAQLAAECVADDRVFNDQDLETIIAAKRRLLQSAGVLEFVDTPASLDQVGGLRRLKAWLKQRECAFSAQARAHGLPAPRGLLLLGVQGAGKSLSAKAIATAWRRPLMRLDPGSLFDRYIGASEQRLADALRQAEAMAPVVLWIDEIEKGFASAASASTDGGLSRRMFGTLLSWMQEHEAPVFLVATANDIEALPPELLRKGRFDEIFFVDLPGPQARREIFRIHLLRRRQKVESFDLDTLVRASEGYSGAEIEAGIVSALYGAVADGRPLDAAKVAAALAGSPPLSVTMAEKVGWLRAWAKGRCVPAEEGDEAG